MLKFTSKRKGSGDLEDVQKLQKPRGRQRRKSFDIEILRGPLVSSTNSLVQLYKGIEEEKEETKSEPKPKVEKLKLASASSTNDVSMFLTFPSVTSIESETQTTPTTEPSTTSSACGDDDVFKSSSRSPSTGRRSSPSFGRVSSSRSPSPSPSPRNLSPFSYISSYVETIDTATSPITPQSGGSWSPIMAEEMMYPQPMPEFASSRWYPEYPERRQV